MNRLWSRYNLPTIKRSLALMGRRKSVYLFFLLLFSAVEIICTMLYSYGIKGAVNAIAANQEQAFMTAMVYILLNHLLWWLYAPISAYGTARISKSTIRDFKSDLCEHITRLPQQYLDSKPAGELLSALSNDFSCLARIYDWSIFQVLRSASGGIGGMVIMAVIDWRFAICVFIFGTSSVLLSARFSRRLELVGQEKQDSLTQISVSTYEMIRAAKTIRLLKLEKTKETEFSSKTEAETRIRIKSGNISAKMITAVGTINALSYLAILFSGALFVKYGLSDWGTIIALMGLKGTADMLFVECGQFMAGLQENITGIKRIFTICDIPEEKAIYTAEIAGESPFALELREVTFAYPGSAPILHDYNLAVKRSRLTVLSGEIGSGKSTIMKLILGLYKPDNGCLIFSVPGIAQSDIRRLTAYVPQETALFRGSILDNIALGNVEASRSDVIQAARQAGADEFIREMAGGYDAELLDNGLNLSGGQRQRLALARALVKNAPILLLDEITSALDRETEASILETIKCISQSKTVLFITHRPDAHDWADEVIMMK